METNIHPTCTGKPPPELAERNREIRAERRRKILVALVDGPATSSELRDRMGMYTWPVVSYWGFSCKGHVVSEYTTRYSVQEISNDLNHFLREGRIKKVKMEGWQHILWSLS